MSRPSPLSQALTWLVAAAAATLVGLQIYLHRATLPAAGAGLLEQALRWIGPTLAAPFGLLILMQILGLLGLLDARWRSGAPRPLTPGMVLEFSVSLAPTLGFLGTVIGMAGFLGRQDAERFAGLDEALGTTALALGMVVVVQLGRLALSDSFRGTLAAEAGEPERTQEPAPPPERSPDRSAERSDRCPPAAAPLTTQHGAPRPQAVPHAR